QAWGAVLAQSGAGLDFVAGAVQNSAGQLESVFQNWSDQQGKSMPQAQAAAVAKSARDARDAVLGSGGDLHDIRVELGLLDENAVPSPELEAAAAEQFAEVFAQQHPGIWEGLDQGGRDQLLVAAQAQQTQLDSTYRLDRWLEARDAAKVAAKAELAASVGLGAPEGGGSPVVMPETGSVGAQAWGAVLAPAGVRLGFPPAPVHD